MAIRYNENAHENAGETTYEGRVVEVFGKEERIMSDVWAWVRYAIVWTEENRPRTIALGNSEFYTHAHEAEVDATEELREKYAAWKEGVARANKDHENERDYNNRMRRAMTPAKGKMVEVVKGRKIPRGTVAEAIWYGPDRYNRYGHRVGIMINGDAVWMNAENVRVKNPWHYYLENR